MAVQDRAGTEFLRPLLHRAQPGPPRAGGHPRGPGQLPGGGELLRVLAAHGVRVAAQRLAAGEAPLRPARSPPVAAEQRRAQRLADVGRAVGRDDRLAGPRHRAVPAVAGRGRVLAAGGRQLHGALRDAPAARRQGGAAALRAGQPEPQLELEQHRHQRAAVPPAAAQRPPRQPHPALPDAARLRGVAEPAHRLRRDDRAGDRARALAPGDGPAGAGALRRRHHPRQHPPAQAAPGAGGLRRRPRHWRRHTR